MNILFQSESDNEQEFIFQNELLVNQGVVTIFEIPKEETAALHG